MNLNELKIFVEKIKNGIISSGIFPKENNYIDYKIDLNISTNKNITENFLINFAKDILSFSNGDGGIILIGFDEDKSTGQIQDIGINKETEELLSKIDLSYISQQFQKIFKASISIDVQPFQISIRKYFYILIEKNNNILIPITDCKEYKLNKGEITYRVNSTNLCANSNSTELNNFIQIKANEKSKEFMEIWSKLLPEMVDINPREVLIINPKRCKVYGFNGKDRILSSSEIEIDDSKNGVFNIILNAISAGEIGKITDNEGKPIYKLVGEIHQTRERIMLSNLDKTIKSKCKYSFTNQQLKSVIKHLGWVTNEKFRLENPEETEINSEFNKYIWIETTDIITKSRKVFFSSEAIQILLDEISKESVQVELFKKKLSIKKEST